MATQFIGEEWDSEEFQTALKVVLKVEIQSLLERLSETGEETVVVTASALDGVTGHLASPKALSFVNTMDIGNVKSKFLNFLTGGNQSQAGRQIVQANQAARGNQAVVINNSMVNRGAVLQRPDVTPKKVDVNVAQSQPKASEKRPFEQGPPSTAVVHPLDPKRRKTDVLTSAVKGGVAVTQAGASVAVAASQSLNVHANKTQLPKLKTTKVVSKKGGFTEERISDAEFKKFLAQYKPDVPESDDDNDSGGVDTKSFKLGTGSQQQQQPLQKQFQCSVQSTPNKATVSNISDKSVKSKVAAPLNQSGKNQNLNQSGEIKKDNSSVKCENVGVINEELVTEIKEENDPDDLEYQKAQGLQKNDQSVTKGSQEGKKDGSGPMDKCNTGNKGRSRMESIDSMDTAALIEMTKAKHLENMSPADREIQAKLGKISSKLSWVVEYPKDKKNQSSPAGQSSQMPRSQEGTISSDGRTMEVHPSFPHSEDEDYEEMDDEEFDDEEDDDDFNEEDLDEEDRAKLKVLREEHMKKLGGMTFGNFRPEGRMYMEGFSVSQEFHSSMMGPGGYENFGENDEDEDYENYGEDDEEDYENFNEEMRMHMQGAMPAMMHGEGGQIYQRPASPTSENFLMIGPIMAKCLICNKIVRKTEMKSHNEMHMNEEDYDEEDEGEEEEGEEGIGEEELEGLKDEDNEGGEEYSEEQEGEEEHFAAEEEGEYSQEYQQSEEPEFTAEKFVAEKLVAEKLEDDSLDVSMKDDSANVCDICGKNFKSKANMTRHKKTVHAAGKTTTEILCPCCSKKLKPSSLKNHIKKMHPDYKESAVVSTESDISADSYKCGVCGDEFTTEDSLQEHVKEKHSS